MRSHRRKTLWSASLLLALAACASGKQDSDKKDDLAGNDGGTPSKDDDDLEVVDAAPMALVGPEFLAQVSDRAGGAAIARSGTDDGRIGGATGAATTVPQAVTAASGHAVAETIELFAAAQELLRKVFGPTGAFKGQPVPFHKGVSERLFAAGTTANGPSYLGVRLLPPESGYRYAVDIYEADGTALRPMTTISYQPVGTSDVRVHLVHAQRNAAGVASYIDTTYDTAEGWAAVDFGADGATTAPGRTTMKLTLEPAKDAVSVLGAYRWDDVPAAAATAPAAPRYYRLVKGDVEAFAYRFHPSTGNAVQNLAFLPIEERAQIGATPGAALFADHGYPKHMVAYVVQSLLRDAGHGCATLGDQLRGAFTGGATPPQSIADAPADLCASNTALTDATVAQIAADACASGARDSFTFCAPYFETAQLANPQRFSVVNGARTLLGAETPVSADHQTLAADLTALGFLDLSSLANAWALPDARDAAPFATAEPLP